MFDLEQPQFRAHAASGREATGAAVGGQDAVARHDRRKRVVRQCLPDCAGGTGRPQHAGHVTVAHGLAGQHAPGHCVDTLVKGRNRGHVECDIGQIGRNHRLTAKHRRQLVDCLPHVAGWR